MAGTPSDVRTLYVTFPNDAEASEICRTLVKEGLIACANAFPIWSVFQWEGKMEQPREVAALLKTTTRSIPRLQRRIVELHSYDIPCIIVWGPEEGLPEYLAWVRQSVDGARKDPRKGP